MTCSMGLKVYSDLDFRPFPLYYPKYMLIYSFDTYTPLARGGGRGGKVVELIFIVMSWRGYGVFSPVLWTKCS